MTRLTGRSRGWVLGLGPLLAATLACSGLSGVGGAPAATPTSPGVAPTAPASAAAPTAAAPTAAAPTTAALPTVAPTTSAATGPAPTAVGTPAAAGANTPTAAPGSAGTVDPCSYFSAADAQGLLGVPVGQPQRLQGSCAYFDAATNTAVVGLYTLPAAQAKAFLGQYVPALEQNGVTVDPKVAAKIAQDIATGDTAAAVNDLRALSAGLPGYEIKPLDGVGSAALWSWHQVDKVQEGALIAAKPGALVALILMGTPTTQEAVEQPAMQAIVTRTLAALPDNFTVAGVP